MGGLRFNLIKATGQHCGGTEEVGETMAVNDPGSPWGAQPPGEEPVEVPRMDVTEVADVQVTRDGVTELDVTEAVVMPSELQAPRAQQAPMQFASTQSASTQPASAEVPGTPGQQPDPPQPYPHPAYPQQPPYDPYAQDQYAQPTAPQQAYAQTPYPSPSPYPQSPPQQPPFYGWGAIPSPTPRPRIPLRAIAAALAIIVVAGSAVAGGLAMARSSSGTTTRPTTGSAAQDAAARAIWRTTPVNQLLPPTITREGTESYIRLGIQPDDSCASLPDAFTAELAATKCVHVLTATYADRTQTVTATVGIVVLSGTVPERLRLFQAWSGDVNATKAAMMPHVYAVPGTVASGFSDKQRVAWQSQLSVDGTYLVYAVAGFTDGRAGPTAAVIAAGSGSAVSSSSPAVQVAGDLPAALQDLLANKIQAAQGGAS